MVSAEAQLIAETAQRVATGEIAHAINTVLGLASELLVDGHAVAVIRSSTRPVMCSDTLSIRELSGLAVQIQGGARNQRSMMKATPALKS